jgi:PAS domain S-box-containing protein
MPDMSKTNNHNLYQILFQQSKDGVFIINSEGTVADANDAFLEMVGYTAAQIKKLNVSQLIAEEELQILTNALLRENAVRDYLLPIRRHNGHVLEVLTSITVQHDANGQIQNYLGIVRELHWRQQANRDFQQKLRTLQRVTTELDRATSLDELYRRAIEFGHNDLGFERMGLLLLDEHTGYMRGTYGINEFGQIVDEHDLFVPPDERHLELVRAKGRSILYEDVPLFTGGKETGRGWNAIAVLWDGEQGVGWLAADNGLTGEPPSEYVLDILTLYGDTIGHLISRKLHEESERLFQQKLQILQEVNLELSRVQDMGELYRRAIERGRDALGFDRIGLLMYDQSTNTMQGTFGTDDKGQLRDEQYFQQAVTDPDVLAIIVEKKRLGFWQTKPLMDEGKPVGKGWNAMAPLWYEDRILGWLAADNLLKREPLLSFQPDLLALYAATLAHLIVRLQAAENLRKQETLLRLVLDTIPQSVFWKDRNSIYLGSNLNFAAAAGLPAPEYLVGKSDYDFWPREQADIFVETDRRVMQGHEPLLGIIESIPQADGTVVWAETNKAPLYDVQGNVIGVLGTSENITKRKQAEETLYQSQQQLAESLARREREVALATQIAQEIASAADLNELYEGAVAQIHEQFGYYHTQLLRYDAAMQTLALAVGYGEVGQKMLGMHHSVPVGVGLIGKAAATGKSILRADLTADPDYRPNPLLPDTKGELAIPIKLRDEVLGVLDIQSNRVNALNANDQLVLEGLCGQVAVAIEGTILRQEMESRLRELNVLQRQMTREGWREYQSARPDLPGYQYDHAGVQLLAEGMMPQTNGHTNGTAKRKQGGTAVTAATLPLQIRNETIGFLGIQSPPDKPLTPDEQEFLDAVSKEVAEALEAARLFEQTQDALSEQERLTAELETVAQVSTVASTILEADALLQAVVDLSKTSFNLYHVHIYLLNETGRKLTLKAGAGNVGRLMALEGREIAIDADSLVARAARTRQGVLENNVRKTVDFLPHPLLPHTQAEMAVPMVLGDKLVGVLDLQSDKVDSFTPEDLKIQRTLASQIAIAIENARQYAEQVETSKKLREVDQLKSEFLASMSHELRTPLNSIIGFADVLLEGLDGDLNERMEEDVRLIRESGRHLRELIGDILDMSKIEAGRMELRYEDVDMRQMANDIMATAQPLAQQKNLDMYLDLDSRVTTVRADRTRIRQVLWNIMGNAIKFTEKGSVSLSMHDQGSHLLIAIRDTGIGIKEENIPIVFEQFRQIDGGLNRAAGGTGLGMPITKKLVEIHGGDIWIESVYGQGSTFFFTLPYVPPVNRPGTGPLSAS